MVTDKRQFIAMSSSCKLAGLRALNYFESTLKAKEEDAIS